MDYGLLWIFCLILFSIYTHGNGYEIDETVKPLLFRFPQNQVLLDSLEHFEIVYPHQVRKNQIFRISTKELKVKHHGTHEHYDHVTFQFELAGRKHKIKLERNTALLSSGILLKNYINEVQQVISRTVEHCYYQGKVKRDAWSAVAVHTCHGISGVILLHNETYIIEALRGGDEGIRHPHVIYKATPSSPGKCGNGIGQWLPFRELHKGEFVRRLKYLKARNLYKRSTGQSSSKKSVKLALVFDTSVHEKLNLTQAAMIRYAIQTANIIDLYYKQVNTRVSLVYAELWNRKDQMFVSHLLRETLQNFLVYKQSKLTEADYHVAQFITCRQFEESSIGMAIPDSVCSDRAVGISQNPSRFEPQQLASTVAHMIAHNLGIKHDEDDGCSCTDQFGCIMSTTVLKNAGIHPRMFSSCSETDLDVTVKMGLASCLSDTPTPNGFSQTCGNSQLERGEECDCGSEEDCARLDPCCDPQTCLLRFWASCRSGPCCENCILRSSTHECRESQTECDVPEFCTGISGECPVNNYIQDGHPCANDTGYCFAGICPTLNHQCQTVWGPAAERADFQCFERFNPTGNFNGHCGRDEKSGKFIKCIPENVQCGLLHCFGGTKSPLLGHDKAFSKTTVFSGGVEYECKIVHGPTALDMPHMGMVQDGTKCGADEVCLNRRCMSIGTLVHLTCPAVDTTGVCAGNGVCTNAGTCFCEKGWTGEACHTWINITTTSVPLPVTTIMSNTTSLFIETVGNVTGVIQPKGSEESTTVQFTKAPLEADGFNLLSTPWLVIILASVIGGLILLCVMTMLCYRRRSPQKRIEKGGKLSVFASAEKSFMKKMSSSEESIKKSFRLIKFGSMPTYKSNKAKMKADKKKRISSGDDSDIGELPPPPIIITSPSGGKPPERGILKTAGGPRRAFLPKDIRDSGMGMLNGVGHEYNADNEYGEDDGDFNFDEEDAELQQILERCLEVNCGTEYGGRVPNSASYDSNPPPQQMFFDSPGPYDTCTLPKYYKLDKERDMMQNSSDRLYSPASSLSSQSRIVRLKNFSDCPQLSRQTIDLSPSPEVPLQEKQISPTNSSLLAGSETEADRECLSVRGVPRRASHTSSSNSSDHKILSPETGFDISVSAMSPFEKSLNLSLVRPPEISPFGIQSILEHTRTKFFGNNVPLATSVPSRSPDVTRSGVRHHRPAPLHVVSGCEKSSGYGSGTEADDGLRSSRSTSGTPSNFSAVIRTGPNQIQLVPGQQMMQATVVPASAPSSSSSISSSSVTAGPGPETSAEKMDRLLTQLPRINAGSFERSPLFPTHNSTAGTNNIKTPPDILPKPRDLKPSKNSPVSAPCIDRSLEEIPQKVSENSDDASETNPDSPVSSKTRRPMSLSVFHKPNLPDSCESLHSKGHEAVSKDMMVSSMRRSAADDHSYCGNIGGAD